MDEMDPAPVGEAPDASPVAEPAPAPVPTPAPEPAAVEPAPLPVVTAPIPAPVEAPRGFRLSLDAACARLSVGDRRVELLAAFHQDESAAGRVLDTEEAYRARFVAFARRPA